MRTLALLTLFVAVATAEYGWKLGSEYRYEVTSKTLASLHETSQEYSGVSVRANLVIQPRNENELIANIEDAEYSQILTPMDEAEEFEIPEEKLRYQPLKLTKEPIIIELKDGVIVDLVLNKDVPVWERNVIRSVVSQLQVNTRGKNLIRSKLNSIPHQRNELTAVYKTMEETVEGECEVLYDVKPLPRYVLQRYPQLAPRQSHEGAIDVVKTKNFSNCEQRPGFHFGFAETTDWEPASNVMGNFLSRSAVSRIILTGDLEQFTIQSSVTTNKVVLSPELYNSQKGEVISRVNVTLRSVETVSRDPQVPSNPQAVHKLVYEYNNPLDKNAHEKSSRRQSSSSSSESNESRQKSRFSKEKSHESNRASSSSSESSSVSSEEFQNIPTMEEAPENPFLPYFVGYKGHSVRTAKDVDIPRVVEKLAERIAEELQTPSQKRDEKSLERFVVLTDVIATMNVEQLENVCQQLYEKESSEYKLSARRISFMVFRDALAQSGTGPALTVIKRMIEKGQIKEEEAAQVIAALPEAAKFPNEEYMKTLFELVKSPVVERQSNLNTSAIFAFSNLLRMSQVSKQSAHNRYPVHTFGRLSSKHRKSVEEQYVPFLAERLRQSVREADSHRIQVYIRALGNVAHPKILAVFEPYLEGKETMTEFQRTLLVVSLNKLAKVHPRLARSVLYKTYANTAEAYQVRVAAVFNLMKTNPPANMLQRMAEFTHQDPSNQVRSAVKSAIESAASLASEANAELRQNAQSAVNMLVPEVLGVQYSRSNITDYVVEGLNLAYTQTVNYIGSDDDLIPRSLLYQLRGDINGYKKTLLRMGGMISSVRDLKDLLEDIVTFYDYDHQKQQDEFNYRKINEILKTEEKPTQKLEANLLLEWANSQRFFAFDTQILYGLPEKFERLLRNFNYRKMFKKDSILLGFPTSSGFPFVYSLETPTLVSLTGKIEADKIAQDKTVKMTAKLEAVYASRKQARISFVTPFDHRRYIAGIDTDYKMSLPIKAQLTVDFSSRRVKLEVTPLDTDGEYKIFSYTMTPYIARYDIMDFKPISEAEDFRIIHVRQPQKFDQEFGQNAGISMRIRGETEKKFLDFTNIYQTYQQHDLISALIYVNTHKTIERNQIDVIYDARRSSAKSVTFTAVFDYSKQESEERNENRAIPSSNSIDSQSRRQELLRKVNSGIKAPFGIVVDLGMKVQGSRNVEYVATIAYASSQTDGKSSLLTYIRNGNQNHEMCIDVNSRTPRVPEIDYNQAIQNQPKSQINAQVRYGQTCQSGSEITIIGKMERTQERLERVRKSPQAQQCLNEIKQGNKLLAGCKNATYNANLMDRYTFTVKYEHVSVEVKNLTYQVYKVLRHWGYPYMQENPIVNDREEKKIELDVQYSPDLTSASVYVSAPIGDVRFENIRLNKYLRTLLVLHPQQSLLQRIGFASSRQQYQPYCTIDKTEVRTFDNQTFPLNLGNEWHVAALSKRLDRTFVVLIRSDSQQQKNVKIVLEGLEMNTLEIQPTNQGSPSGAVTFNGEKIELSGDETIERKTGKGIIIMQVAVLSTGEVRMIFPFDEIEILYDRVRVQLILGQTYRNRMGGLCGDFDGEQFDFVTPQQYLLNDPEQFAATWSLSNDGKTAQLKRLAQKYSDYKKQVYLTDAISEQDAGRANLLGRKHDKGYDYDSSSSSSSSESNEDECKTKRTVVVEHEGKHCFSLHQQEVCSKSCKVQSTKKLAGKFVCVNKTQTSSHWAQMVARGAKLNLREKGNAQDVEYEGHVSCTP